MGSNQFTLAQDSVCIAHPDKHYIRTLNVGIYVCVARPQGDAAKYDLSYYSPCGEIMNGKHCVCLCVLVSLCESLLCGLFKAG